MTSEILTIIGSGYGLLQLWYQAITWTHAGLFLIWSPGRHFNEIWFEIQPFSFNQIQLEIVGHFI